MPHFGSIVLTICAVLQLALASTPNTNNQHSPLAVADSVHPQSPLDDLRQNTSTTYGLTGNNALTVTSSNVVPIDPAVKEGGEKLSKRQSTTQPLSASMDAVKLKEATQRVDSVTLGKVLESKRAPTTYLSPLTKILRDKTQQIQTFFSSKLRTHQTLSQELNKSLGRNSLRRATHQARRQSESGRQQRRRETREELWEG